MTYCCWLRLAVVSTFMVVVQSRRIKKPTGEGVAKSAAKTSTAGVDDPTAMMEQTSKLSLVRDPFARSSSPYLAIDAGPSNGCGLSGWTGAYYMAGAIQVFKLVIGQTSVTFESTSGDFLSLIRKSGFEHVDNLVGTHTLGEFRDMMNHPVIDKLFPDASAFFAPSNLALVCPVLAGGQALQGIRTAGGHALQGIQNAVGQINLPGIRDPFAISSLGPSAVFEAGKSNGCGLSGWSGTYYMGGVEVVNLDVRPTSVTFTSNVIHVLATLRQVGIDGIEDLVGAHSLNEFRDLVNRPAIDRMFPWAVSFFAPPNLALVCPVMAGGQALEGIRSAVAKVPMPGVKDPFAHSSLGPFGGLEAGKSNGCGLSEWTGTYYYFGGTIQVARLVVGSTSVTLTSDNNDFVSMFRKLGDSVEEIFGTHSLDEFREIVGRPMVQMMFRDASAFFTPSNLALVCPVLAGGQALHGIRSAIGGWWNKV